MIEKPSNGKKADENIMLYAIRTRNRKAELSNDRIIEAEAEYDVNGRPQIIFQFDKTGTRLWENMTRNARGNFVAMIIDGQVVSAPLVNEPITSGKSTVSGLFTVEETNNLAMQLRTGLAPAKLSIVSESITLEKGSTGSKRLLTAGIAFAIGAIIGFVILNALKSK
jgi:SecD/SecF fusion protein